MSDQTAPPTVQVGNALRAQGKAGLRPKLAVPPSGLVVPDLRAR